VISGEEESVEMVKEAHDLIKGSVFKVVSAAGHYSCMENPHEFNLCVNEFLASIRSKPR
jgi:pimeloyl-ACP methyl ester carboxylesterase